jgi:hypothetical protein
VKICEAEFFHVDVQTALTKRIIALRTFANALKIVVMEGFQLYSNWQKEKKFKTTFFCHKTIDFVFMSVLRVSTWWYHNQT